MCRHFGYLGEPVPLDSLVLRAEHSLFRQSYAPAEQRFGTVNVDGFGVGWHLPERREPVRYRRAQPIWTDASFASLAPTIRAGSIVASVRAGSPGFAHDESCAAPFTHGPWLFSHNGTLCDIDAVRRALWDQAIGIPDATAPVDSALLFAVTLRHVESGLDPARALEQVIATVAELGGGRMNLLLSDGVTLAATTYGDTLYRRRTAAGVTVASEPLDRHDWERIEPDSVLTASRETDTVRPLDAPPCPHFEGTDQA